MSADDLVRWDSIELLSRVFAEDEVRHFDPRPVTLRCQCSHAQISAMLLGLGQAEADAVVAEQGQVEITCEFCGRQYRYSSAETQALFRADIQDDVGQTRQ